MRAYLLLTKLVWVRSIRYTWASGKLGAFVFVGLVVEDGAMSHAQRADAPPGLSVCPSCKTEFEERRVYRIEQIATLMGVKPNTVKWWMSSGLLKFRLWAKGGGIVMRVVMAPDFDEFLNAKLGRPGDGSKVAAHWARIQAVGAMGHAARRAKAKLYDQSTQHDEPVIKDQTATYIADNSKCICIRPDEPPAEYHWVSCPCFKP